MSYSKQLDSIKTYISEQQGRRKVFAEEKKKLENRNIILSKKMDALLKARSIVQIVAEQTQKKLEYHISNLVSMALASVFPEPYAFQLRFVQKRNKTEAELIFSKNGNETNDILNSGGGGVADIASIALRISLWGIKKTRPTLILDESLKFLHSPEYQEKASQMLKEVSEKLGLQIIIVSDQQNILEYADKVIKIVNYNGISKVENNEEQKNIKIFRRKLKK
jgi:ABC-type cobalamin/Fe3+-siderophores transport system ATPase subunit